MAERETGADPATLSADDAFTLLGDGTRVGILRALWEAYDPYAADSALPFSDLFERVDADDTGNFNYHLGRLTGHFLRRTDAGYELTAPGFRVVRAILAGGVTGDPALGPTPVDANCERCGSRVQITYEDGTTWVRCSGCEGYWPQRGGEIFGFSLPPEGLRGREANEILDATITYSINRFATMAGGVCPECGSAVDTSLSVCGTHDGDGGVCDACGSYFVGVVVSVCTACKFAWRSPAYAPVSHHPALVSFYYDHGVEHVPSTWDAIVRGFDWTEEPRSTDPPSLRITVSHGGDRREFVLDEAATVVEVTG